MGRDAVKELDQVLLKESDVLQMLLSHVAFGHWASISGASSTDCYLWMAAFSRSPEIGTVAVTLNMTFGVKEEIGALAAKF